MKITSLPQFLAIEHHFVQKGCAGSVQIAILPEFLVIEHHFVQKCCAGSVQIAILPQFLAIEPHFVRKGRAGPVKITSLPQFLAIEPHFVRKGCDRTHENHNFTSLDQQTDRKKRLFWSMTQFEPIDLFGVSRSGNSTQTTQNG